MITKFIIKRRTTSAAWDVSKLVTNVKWTNDMNFSAGELDFNLLEVGDGFAPHNGDIVLFEWDNRPIFKGYIFKHELKAGKSYDITAFDALRYFKNNDSMVFPVTTLGQRFNTICKYLKLDHKVVKAPSYKLKAEVDDNKSYFSMLQSGIYTTYKHTGEHYFLKDNYGVIELRRYPYKTLNTIIGDGSLLNDYTLTRSIDQTANVVKVVSSSTKKGKKKTATEQATGDSVKNWGKLVHIEQAAKKMNAAQMKQLAQQTLKRLNRETTQLKISAVGDVDLQAGNSVIVAVNDLNDVGIKPKRYLIRKAVHTFGTNYSVDIEMEF